VAATPTPADRPRRRDAQRNRDALTATAASAFRAEGLDVAVDELAQRAGVGVATLYRHFPTKLDLVQAVLDAVLDELDQAATGAVAEAAQTPVLEAFLTAAAAQQEANRGFLEALAQSGLPDDARRRMADRVVAILAPVAAAAHAAGALRPELDATDLLVVVRMLGATTVPGGRAPERYVRLLLTGLAPATV